MKKLTVWALLAMLVVAGSAFAQTPVTGAPASLANDDSCDIGVTPAATLLLPYFEVDLTSRTGEDTIFTITNTSNVSQVAHITLWTDYSFPVIDFNVFLTGYDVQGINLYDVIALGQIAPPSGTSSNSKISPVGDYSVVDNPLVTEATCSNLPMQLGQVYIDRMQQAFTKGKTPAIPGSNISACNNIGGVHNNAVGYATIDTASICGTALPSDPDYFTAGGEGLFENVLIGDYQQINSGQNFAQGNPMVHIRAIPEGGTAAAPLATDLLRTFYSRYQDAATPTADRRQPLPSTFAARWINGGTGSFQTSFKIWREGDTAGLADCATVAGNVTEVTEFVTFDEKENAWGAAPSGGPVSPPIELQFALPETGRYDFAGATGGASTFPQPDNGATAGWVYMNLNNVPAGDAPLASQNWVVVSMRAEGRYSVDFDAAWLGNGCTGQTPISEVNADGGPVIGPADNTVVGFNGGVLP